LRAADAIILVVPEWNGMVPPALMNLFLLAGRGELAHKPALAVTLSSGQGGAYPLAELRAYGYKNTRLCYIPDHVIVRFVENVLNEVDNISSEEDRLIRHRLAYSLNILDVYSTAFKQIRSSQVIDLINYPYGM
jgi:hypothetical protein